MLTSANSVNIEVLVVLLPKFIVCLLLLEKLDYVVDLIYVDKMLSDISDLLDLDDFI